MMSGLTAFTFSTNFDVGTSHPMSCTSKPFAVSIAATMLLPMSWMSPSTVPMTTLPRTFLLFPSATAGSSMAKAFFVASADIINIGRNISPLPNLSPTTCKPVAKPSSIALSGSKPVSITSWAALTASSTS